MLTNGAVYLLSEYFSLRVLVQLPLSSTLLQVFISLLNDAYF